MDNENKGWGGWATFGLGLVVFFTFSTVQSLVLIPVIVMKVLENPDLNFDQTMKDLTMNGDIVSLSTILGGLVGIGVTYLLARVKLKENTRDWLGLRGVDKFVMFKCLGFILVFIICWDLTTLALGKEIVPKFMREVYSSTKVVVGLWIGICIMAPLFEEIFFRGFLLKGLADSRIGKSAAVVLTSLFWAVIHMQYGFYEIASIFLIGIVLSIMRLRTGSIYPAIACHMFMNVWATIETVLVLNGVLKL